MARSSRRPDYDDAVLSPLWGLVEVLGDLAVRTSRPKADAHAGQTPETRRGAGSDPASGGEASR